MLAVPLTLLTLVLPGVLVALELWSAAGLSLALALLVSFGGVAEMRDGLPESRAPSSSTLGGGPQARREA